MDARTVRLLSHSGVDSDFARSIARWVVGGALAILWLTAVTLIARRLAGALVEPLPALALLALGCTLAALAVLCRVVGRQVGSARTIDRLPLPAVLLSAAAISLPDSSIMGLIALWSVVLGEELWSWRVPLRGVEAPLPVPRPAPVGDDIRIDPPQTPMPHFPAEDVSQQITRSRASDGGEIMAGWLRVALEPGQRTTAAHVAFCPPFAETPRLTVRQTSGPPARIKEGQVLPHGMRLEIKLNEVHPAGASVLIEFAAQSAAGRPQAVSTRRG